MILTYLVGLIGLVFLAKAFTTDVLTNEIDNKISLGFLGVNLAIAVGSSIYYSDPWILIEVIFITWIYIAIFLIPWTLRSGVGAGDVKIMAGVGSSLSLLNALGHNWSLKIAPYFINGLIFMILPALFISIIIPLLDKTKTIKEKIKTIATKTYPFMPFILLGYTITIF